MKAKTFEQCHKAFPEWVDSSMADFTFDDPKGFSSFTMGIRTKNAVQPTAVFYRRLEGKENAILDYETEKELFLLLGVHNIAAHCYYYDETCRIEAFYQGRTLRLCPSPPSLSRRFTLSLTRNNDLPNFYSQMSKGLERIEEELNISRLE